MIIMRKALIDRLGKLGVKNVKCEQYKNIAFCEVKEKACGKLSSIYLITLESLHNEGRCVLKWMTL